jgi:hypothetical protein
MRRVPIVMVAVALVALGCGSSAPSSVPTNVQKQADLYQIDQIEATWHQAASTHNVDLMMSIWAPDATFSLGTRELTGQDQIRAFFATEAAPFKPENNWVSETPAYKIRATVDGDKGTLYFECHYVDVATRTVKSVVGADQKVARINGKWLITESVSATPVLAP